MKKVVIIFALFAMVVNPVIAVAESLQEQLNRIESELNVIRSEKSNLTSEIKKAQSIINSYSGRVGALRAEMETFQLEIAELELQIDELEVNLELLEVDMDAKQDEVEEKQGFVDDVQTTVDKRIIQNYIKSRTSGMSGADFFIAKDANSFFLDSQYNRIIQSKYQSVIGELQLKKAELEKDIQILEERQVTVLRDKAIIDEQKSQLATKRGELERSLNSYYGAIYSQQGAIAGIQSEVNSISKEEAQKSAEAEKIRQTIFNSFNSIPSGRYVVAGTMIGRQGATGLATGPHVHFSVRKDGAMYNPCVYVPGGKFGNCAGNGQLQWPLQGAFYFTSGYGNRCISSLGYCSFHSAIDIAHSTWNAPVYAAHSGYLYKGVDQYGALYIIICQNAGNCNSGFKTGYWHLSSY